jgi:UPF0271 protein
MDINLNADLGESFGAWRMGNDEAMLRIVQSANVACGFHAGDPLVMSETVRLAREAGADIGAHPSFPDLQGFGRRPMRLSPRELEAVVIYQVGALAAMARAQGTRLSHVKPHGAMHNMACEDADMARSIVHAVKAYDPNLILLAPPLSELAQAGQDAGLRVAQEVFADRAYTDAGTLAPRGQPGAVLEATEDCLAQVLRMIDRRGIVSVHGKVLPTPFHSICVHGDNEHAVATAAALRQALLAAGHRLLSLPELV